MALYQTRMVLNKEEVFCRRCGRRLRDQNSKTCGIGPGCREKKRRFKLPERIKKIIDQYITREFSLGGSK